MTTEPDGFVSLLTEPTEDEIRAHEEAERANRARAHEILAQTLVAAGAPPTAVEAVMPAIMDTLRPRIERATGLLSETGILTHGYLWGTMHPAYFDSEWPGHAEFKAEIDAARERVRPYEIVRLTTDWTEVTDVRP